MRDFEVELLQKYTVKVLDSNRICCPRSTLSNSPVHPVRSPATGPLRQLTAPFNAFTVKFKIRAHFKSSAGWLDHGNASAGWLDCSTKCTGEKHSRPRLLPQTPALAAAGL